MTRAGGPAAASAAMTPASGSASASAASATAPTSSRGRTGTGASGTGQSAAMARTFGTSGKRKGLSFCGAVNLDLRMGGGLEALDDDEVDGGEAREELGEAGLRLGPQLMHQGPAPLGGDQHLPGAGGPVLERVLAGLVDLEGVMGVLDASRPRAPRWLSSGMSRSSRVVFPAPLHPARPITRIRPLPCNGRGRVGEADRVRASAGHSPSTPTLSRKRERGSTPPAPGRGRRRLAGRSRSSPAAHRPRRGGDGAPRRGRPRRSPWRRRRPPCRASRCRCGRS